MARLRSLKYLYTYRHGRVLKLSIILRTLERRFGSEVDIESIPFDVEYAALEEALA